MCSKLLSIAKLFSSECNKEDGLKNMEFKGSKTEKNVLAAFAGESQARTRYSFFSSVAKKEGYEQLSEIFLKTAENEGCLLYTSDAADE